MLTLVIYAKNNRYENIRLLFNAEIQKDKHWEGFKVPIETVYKRTCEALGLHFIRYDKLKNQLVIGE